MWYDDTTDLKIENYKKPTKKATRDNKEIEKFSRCKVNTKNKLYSHIQKNGQLESEIMK